MTDRSAVIRGVTLSSVPTFRRFIILHKLLALAQILQAGLALRGSELDPLEAGDLPLFLHRIQAFGHVIDSAAELLFVGSLFVVPLLRTQLDDEDLDGDGARPAVELLQGFHDLLEDRG